MKIQDVSEGVRLRSAAKAQKAGSPRRIKRFVVSPVQRVQSRGRAVARAMPQPAFAAGESVEAGFRAARQRQGSSVRCARRAVRQRARARARPPSPPARGAL